MRDLFMSMLLVISTALLTLSSCDKELVSVEKADDNNEENIIYASTEDGRTKTSLNGNDAEGYQVVWSEGDVFGYRVSKKYYKQFILESGAGTTKGTFIVRGGMPDNTSDYTLFYPLEFTEEYWPVTQTYTKNNITGSPMYAELKAGFTADAHIQFKNVGGILRLTITGAKTDTIKSITVNAKNPDISITLDCSNEGNGVALSPDGVQFHIAMPSADGIITADENDELASYSNVSIYLTDTNGKVCCKSPKAATLDIVRSQITKATFSVNSKDFYSYTTGSKVKIHGHEGIVVDLNHDKAADVIVATMNVGATAVKGEGCLGDKMNYDEACAAWSGWRLPTVNEIKTLCDFEYPTWGSTDAGEPGDGSNSILAWYIDDVDGIDLYLPLNDYDEDAYYNQYDKYWTGTPGSGDTYYYFAPELIYDSGDGGFTYYPVTYDDRTGVPYKEEAAKTSKFLVRLFHDLP